MIKQRHSATKILVLWIFPRFGGAEQEMSPPAFNSSARCIATCRRAGELTAQLADGKQVFWLDLNCVFLKPNGTINTDRIYLLRSLPDISYESKTLPRLLTMDSISEATSVG